MSGRSETSQETEPTASTDGYSRCSPEDATDRDRREWSEGTRYGATGHRDSRLARRIYRRSWTSGQNCFHARLRTSIMVNVNMQQGTAKSRIADLASLTRPRHRPPALVALTEAPGCRSERCEPTGGPSSTIRRTLDEFDGEAADCFLSPNQETIPIQHDACAVTRLNSVTGGSGDGCWTRWAE